MKTVGQIFLQKRKEKKLSLDDVEKSTKIRKKFLDAIERDAFSELPSQAYTKGFIKNYASFLGYDASVLIAFYRRQTLEAPKNTLLPKDTERVLKRSWFRLTPSRFLVLFGLSLALIFFCYFFLQYQRIQSPPSLTIQSPAIGFETVDRRIDVTGQTDADATVIVNGVSVVVRSDGKFFDQVTLELGANKITVSSTSKFGKVATQIREVKRIE